MHPLAHHLMTMAYNSAWANHRLLKACAQLSQADFVAVRVSFFPTIRATLNHNLTVDWYYVDALERSLQGREINLNPNAFYEPEEPFATCAELWTAQREVDTRLVNLCKALPEDLQFPIQLPRRAGVMTETLTRLLAHLFQHQIHHRGQAHAMLAGTLVAPPQLDEFFCEGGDKALRQPDFAALGFDEAQIWQNSAIS